MRRRRLRLGPQLCVTVSGPADFALLVPDGEHLRRLLALVDGRTVLNEVHDLGDDGHALLALLVWKEQP